MDEITVEQLVALDRPALIDVREPDEYASGHAPGAINLPLSTLAECVGDVPATGPVHIICQAGGRSAKAAAFLVECGIVAINVVGGTNAWIENGHAVELNNP